MALVAMELDVGGELSGLLDSSLLLSTGGYWCDLLRNWGQEVEQI